MKATGNRSVSPSSLHGGFSSGVYYSSSGQVPFEWETQPGTPKRPSQSEPLPPLSPPPALQSALLARCRHQAGVGTTPGLKLKIWNAMTRSAHGGDANHRRRAARRCVACGGSSSSASPAGCFLKPLKLPILRTIKKKWDF